MMPSDIESSLTVERLRSLLLYNRRTGKFLRRRKVNQHAVDVVCGWVCPKSGYVIIKLDGRKFLAHRLAWLFVYGVWPDDRIDHKNCVRSDNWIDNLRPATDRQNSANARVRSDNRLGLKGVSLHSPGRYKARIAIPGTKASRYLGLFGTKEEASAAYQRAADILFNEFARAA